jgi:hypothetical protein
MSDGNGEREFIKIHILVGGLEHEFYDFPLNILGMSSSQLTNSLHFSEG